MKLIDNFRLNLTNLPFIKTGPKSYEDLKTVNENQCETFREACQKLGLLNDDQEWNIALTEASSFMTNIDSLRDLFALILINCQPSNPNLLWEKHRDSLCGDLFHQFNKEITRFSNTQIYDYGLYLLDKKVKLTYLTIFTGIITNTTTLKLLDYGKSLDDFESIPKYSQRTLELFQLKANDKRNLISQELEYDVEKLHDELKNNIPKLNFEQKLVSIWF